MKCKKAGMEEGKSPIKPLWAGWRRETFQTQYPIQNCSLPWKWKIISAMDTNMKCKKARIKEGIRPINLCEPGVGGKQSKQYILCGTVHDYHENEK